MRILSRALVLALAWTSAASAQVGAAPDEPVAAATQGGGATATCMSRRVTKGGGRPFDFVVPVPASLAAQFTDKGFAPATCTEGAMQRAVRFKASMCELARGNDAVQIRTEEVLGFTATKLCAAAKLLLPDGPTTQGAAPAGQAAPGG